ncbi:hypothetical protein PCC9214_05806 [Planktothrix tepida]|uniref:Uncharacterized protein n=1 Tax=Planktothrix tepida PCC 9214 TaxID=671072 RepID=A0A1J1LS15_9CYAN|nr:hypothetical protein [Planktothrix tepida]CAD5990477.1 hypothetical protein PCC9214_05806 [Planktothrix tepida]CUR35400.1 conserved hypothetical protein [Planktothrix tepida PCC 9214]
MVNDIKITMLGTQAAGKTCYMLGMYAAMQTGVRGFSLSAKDMDIDLELTDLWEKLIDFEGKDRWPPPNAAEVKNYAFDFNYGLQPIMGFEWLDYRGGAMSDRSTEQDVKQLLEHFSNSSCLFLCVSGEYLTKKVDQSTVRQIRSNRMNQFLQNIGQQIKPTPSHPFPVAVVITKYDLCSQRPRQEIIEDVKQLFQPLFAQNSGWLVMICPVSLGKELANDVDYGSIVPVNVHLPVVFAIYSKFSEYGLGIKAQKSDTSGELKKLNQSNFFMKWLNSDEIQNKESKLQELDSQIQEIESNMALLAQELQRVSIFRNGKEVTVDV